MLKKLTRYNVTLHWAMKTFPRHDETDAEIVVVDAADAVVATADVVLDDSKSPPVWPGVKVHSTGNSKVQQNWRQNAASTRQKEKPNALS